MRNPRPQLSKPRAWQSERRVAHPSANPLIGAIRAAGGAGFIATIATDQMRSRRSGAQRFSPYQRSRSALARLRPRTPARDLPCGRASRLRPRRHALRSREQLRAAVRSAEQTSVTLPRQDLRAVPRRADHLHEAGYDMWPGPYGDRQLAQVPAREPRPEPWRGWARLRRHLLLPPL